MAKRLLLLLLALSVVVPAALADTFTLDNYSVSLQTTDPGLVLDWAPAQSTPYSFNLNPGQTSGWFNLFDLWTDETTVNNPDDLAHSAISVTMNFSLPPSTGTVTGETFGTRFPSSGFLSGLIQYGQVTWDGPVVVSFGDGGQYTIFLQDATFNAGLFGLSPGERHGADIYAKVRYDTAPVPEPASMLLLGSGLASALAMKRRNRHKHD